MSDVSLAWLFLILKGQNNLLTRPKSTPSNLKVNLRAYLTRHTASFIAKRIILPAIHNNSRKGESIRRMTISYGKNIMSRFKRWCKRGLFQK